MQNSKSTSVFARNLIFLFLKIVNNAEGSRFYIQNHRLQSRAAPGKRECFYFETYSYSKYTMPYKMEPL